MVTSLKLIVTLVGSLFDAIAVATVELKVVISELLIFRAVAEPRNSDKSAKSCEVHKNTQNTAKFGRNLMKYMSVQQF